MTFFFNYSILIWRGQKRLILVFEHPYYLLCYNSILPTFVIGSSKYSTLHLAMAFNTYSNKNSSVDFNCNKVEDRIKERLYWDFFFLSVDL